MGVEPGKMLCIREGCNHPANWHRLDDAKNVSPTDPKAEFRCIGFDADLDGAPPVEDGCTCPNFCPGEDWLAYWKELTRV